MKVEQFLCALAIYSVTILKVFASESSTSHHVRKRRQEESGYDTGPLTDRQIHITFINKSGRRTKIYQSNPYGYEIMYRFLLRPNEPKTISVEPDGSFFVVYDYLTNSEFRINHRRRLETNRIPPGIPFDAMIGTNFNLRAEPYMRGKLPPRYIETMVVVDPSMIKYHGENVEEYTMTLMNIVARTFMHKSLNVPIFISVTKFVKMTYNPVYYKIEENKPETSVQGACRYSFERNDVENEVDFALTLTKENIGPAGYASMYTMCTKRSCALVKDDGPDTGFVIAHELAHALGIDHDEEDDCKNPNRASIMAKKLYSTSSSHSWSKCSQRMLRENLKYFKCLKNVPILMPRFQENLMNLPGEILNIDEQCQAHYGNSSRGCTKRVLSMCRYLWCHPNPITQCRPLWFKSPLEGSTCDQDKWCMHSTCIVKKKKEPINGAWSTWLPWQPPCNEVQKAWLIQRRNRTCTNPKPEFNGKPCTGIDFEDRVVIPYQNNVCKPYTFKRMVLNKAIDNRLVLDDGCSRLTKDGKMWVPYTDLLQKKHVERLKMTCDFEGESCGWQSSKKGVKPWSQAQGSTPSGQTGPLFDHTFANASGHYLYYESSWTERTPQLRNGDRVILESPLILASTTCLRFFYHMHGADVQGLEVILNNGNYHRKVWEKIGPQGNLWFLAEVNLEVNIEYFITIEAIRGNGYSSDIAVDDIRFTFGHCKSPAKATKTTCTIMCADIDSTAMLRSYLGEGTPCASASSPNNVCYQQKCQSVNCRGIIGKSNC